ncbi:MAG: transcriptional modulator of MazE/toxin, MazF [Acidobacteria bacterium]|jgi:mRNA interferase MazF|nr:transcriptional modulator of MazE/toxin, MazF [Acidobacteriota bacterium]
MVIGRGEIWWASLPDPAGSSPGLRRPVLIVQSDAFNQSKIQTVVVAVITKNLELAKAPGNVTITARISRLPIDSVVNVSQVITIDKNLLTEFVSTLPSKKMEKIEEGLRLVLSL